VLEPVIVLALAWSLGGIIGLSGTADFIAKGLLAGGLPLWALPSITSVSDCHQYTTDVLVGTIVSRLLPFFFSYYLLRCLIFASMHLLQMGRVHSSSLPFPRQFLCVPSSIALVVVVVVVVFSSPVAGVRYFLRHWLFVRHHGHFVPSDWAAGVDAGRWLPPCTPALLRRGVRRLPVRKHVFAHC